MKSIFEKTNFDELLNRFQKINSTSKPLWGKMNVAQMLHHLNLTMEAPLGKAATKGKPIFFMRLFKGILYNDKPFGKGDPTPKDFIITASYNFETEKEKFIFNIKEIFNRNVSGNYLPHVFFGKITNEQWGIHFYKHTDHHLRQFGA